MERFHRLGLVGFAGLALLAAAGALQFILYETVAGTVALAGAGAALAGWAGFALRAELGALTRRRRVEIALRAVAIVGIVVALGYVSVRYPLRHDFTAQRLHSLSDQSVAVLSRLEKPVHIVFFHNHLMGRTMDLYRLVADGSDMVTVEFHDPALNPARARMLNIRFPGTAAMTSEGRRIDVDGDQEADIVNGVLRVSQGATRHVCFLDGHGEADPYSKEGHDHLESTGGHTHGSGIQYVLHETHGMAKARNGLEELNYTAGKVSLLKGGDDPLAGCAVLVVAGPRSPLLAEEVARLRGWLAAGGDALFMLEPGAEAGLGPVLRDYGVAADRAMAIDPSHHFAADPSSPAVSDYNHHKITRDLPLTFFPGVRPLSPAARVPGVSVTPVVSSSRNSYGETSTDRPGRDEGADLPGPLTLMVAANKRPPREGEAAVLARLERTDEAGDGAAPADGHVPTIATAPSRVAVVGDSDFATNSFFHVMGNGNLFLNAVNYLAAQENLIGIEPHTRELPEINFTNRQMKATFFVAVFLAPLLLALVGTAVWWRQR